MKISPELTLQQQQQCVELRAEGFTPAQIAARVGISFLTVKKRLMSYDAGTVINEPIEETIIEQQTVTEESMSFTPDYQQLKLMSKSQVQARVVELGADYHPAESKTDLIARLLQLQGTAQPIDKIRKELEANGVGEDGASTVAIPKQRQRLTIEQMKTAMKKYIDKGMKFRVTKDGENWEMYFVCDQLEQGGKILKAQRRDSGNTMIPLNVLIRAAETITTFNTYKKRDINAPEGFVEVQASEDAPDMVA